MTSSVWKRNSLQLLVWRRGFCLKNKTDFCFFLSGQFSFQLLENCMLKGLKSGKEKGSTQQFEPFIYFFLFPFQRPGWGEGGVQPHYPPHPAHPARREQRSQCHGNGRWHEAGGRAPSPTSGRTALLISSGAESN